MSDETKKEPNGLVKFMVQVWIDEEREDYADLKWNEEALAELKEKMRAGEMDDWMQFVYNYLTRVNVIGLKEMNGRQALGKTIVTLLRILETAVEEFGPMPAPGVPSGEITEW